MMDSDPIILQIDQMIQQRIGEPSYQYANIQTPSHAAASLLLDLGPEYDGESEDRRTARAYLTSLTVDD
jgi:hypothetical protein